MGYIYLNSVCNIAATVGENSNSGLFRERDPFVIRPIRVAIPWRSRGFNAPVLSYNLWPRDYWSNHIDGATLNTRGWVVQERVLSPRVLHFGAEQLHWECMYHRASETFSFGHPESSFRKSFSKAAAKPLHNTKRSWDLFAIYNAWNFFVKAYSRCNFTVDSDILLAAAGIAEVCRKNTGVHSNDYLAGLWHVKSDEPSELLVGLTWYSLSFAGTAVRRPRPLQAPTWSWASVKGPVEYHGLYHPDDKIWFLEIVRVDFSSSAVMARNAPQISLLIRTHLQLCRIKVKKEPKKPATYTSVLIFIGDQEIWAEGRIDDWDLIQEYASGKGNKVFAIITIMSGRSPNFQQMEGLLLQEMPAMIDVFERCGSFVAKGGFESDALRQQWNDKSTREVDFGRAKIVTLR
jgi:hypothetical protein